FAREQWSRELVRQCARTQSEIVDHAWEALAPGGSLIYSTCTWERSENEDQLQRTIDHHGAAPIEIPLDGSWGSQRTDRGLRCYPHSSRGEGFFIGAVRKPGTWRPRGDLTITDVADM